LIETNLYQYQFVSTGIMRCMPTGMGFDGITPRTQIETDLPFSMRSVLSEKVQTG
jgi:hypothetical protein